MAALRGVRTHVLEEGYLRPDWMTFEPEGVNARSTLSREKDWFLKENRHLVPEPEEPPVTAAFKRRAREFILALSPCRHRAIAVSPLSVASFWIDYPRRTGLAVEVPARAAPRQAGPGGLAGAYGRAEVSPAAATFRRLPDSRALAFSGYAERGEICLRELRRPCAAPGPSAGQGPSDGLRFFRLAGVRSPRGCAPQFARSAPFRRRWQSRRDGRSPREVWCASTARRRRSRWRAMFPSVRLAMRSTTSPA